MRKILLLVGLTMCLGYSFAQITISPNTGCVGSTFQITITGTVPLQSGTPCSGVSGVFSGATVIAQTQNPVQASAPYTVNLTVPANVAPGTYDFAIALQKNGMCYRGSCVSCLTLGTIPSNVSISPGGAFTRCPGQSVNLLCGATDATSFQWKLNGGDIPGAVNAGTFAGSTGTYSCVATNGCGNTPSSNSVVLTVDTPTTPVITQTGHTLHANSSIAVSYRWFLNGDSISAADSVFNPVVAGSYTVRITNASGCTAMSGAYNYVLNGISNLSNDLHMDLVPNPARDAVTISTNLKNGFNAGLYTLSGQMVQSVQSVNAYVTIDVGALSKGIYVVKLSNSQGQVFRKLIIE